MLLAPFGVTLGGADTLMSLRYSTAAWSAGSSVDWMADRIFSLTGTPRSVSITSAASWLFARKSTSNAASPGCLLREKIDQYMDGFRYVPRCFASASPGIRSSFRFWPLAAASDVSCVFHHVPNADMLVAVPDWSRLPVARSTV